MFKSLSGLLLPLLVSVLPSPANSLCYDPSPAFPLPEYTASSPELQHAFHNIAKSLNAVVANATFNTTSFSLEITSSKETLWSLHHTAVERDESRPGTAIVNGSSVYRIASVSKVFTVLGILQQHIAGKLHLDDTIDKHIPELREKQKGTIPWKDITLRTLGSQLSGIPNDFAQGDLLTGLRDPSALGLPPMTKKGLPKCGSFTHSQTPCSRDDLLTSLQSFEALYPPKQQSTYSNMAFELLGLALEAVTNAPYAHVITSSILNPLGMNNTSLVKPPDDVAVIPKGENYWDVEEGVQNPTGGIYSTSTDLSTFLRHILTTYNGMTPTLNWLQPASYTYGLNSFFGMPWEIYRTNTILPHTNRPVTFVTKSGGVPAYFSIIMALPEYDLGVTILVAGADQLLEQIREIVAVELVRAAEDVAQKALREKYVGHYVSAEDETLNSSITLAQSLHAGLYVDSWISNGTDLLVAFGPLAVSLTGGVSEWRAQCVPTLLFKDELHKKGEIWRMEIVPEKEKEQEEKVWDEFCITHIDNLRYAGVPLNEVVFWNGDAEGRFGEIELSAFRVTLQRKEGGKGRAYGLADQAQRVMTDEDGWSEFARNIL